MSVFEYKNGLKFYRFTKQLTYEEIIKDKVYMDIDFLIKLENLIKILKEKFENKNFINLLIRLICNHYKKFFPKKYNYTKEIIDNYVLINFTIEDNEIEYEDINTVSEFEKYINKNNLFIRDHINYKLEIKQYESRNINNFIEQINKYVINNYNSYNVKELINEYNDDYNYSKILEFIFINKMYTDINKLNYNKFYNYILEIIENKKIYEIKNINDIYNNFELLFCNEIKVKLFFHKMYDSPYYYVYKINTIVLEKVLNIINKIDKLSDNITIKKESIKKEPIKKEVKIKVKKQTIPKPLKKLVWNKYIGEEIGKAKCLCCKLTDITQLSFHCGHIISEKNGGELTVENLKPICQSCNSSMGTQNMNEFINKYKLNI